MDSSSNRHKITSSTNPAAPGYPYHASATTATTMSQAKNNGHTKTRSHHSRSHCHGSSSRRRPRIGIFSGNGDYYDAPAGIESNWEGLELALQDSSKTTSSSSATASVSSPGTSSSPLRNDKELVQIQHQHLHQYNQHHKQTINSHPSDKDSPLLSPNHTNPFGPSYPSCSTTTTNPFEDRHLVLTEQSQCDDETDRNRDEDVYVDAACEIVADRPRKGQPATSSLVSSTLQKVPYKNPFGGLDTTTNPFDGPDMNDDVHCDNTSSMSSASRDDFSGSRDYLALHRLCAEASSQNDITWWNALNLLSTKPELARGTTDHGHTALHVACLGGNTSSTSNTTGATSTTHRSSQRDQEEDVRGTQARKLPLHMQKQQKSVSPPEFIIRALVLANPSAVKQANADGRLPIHCLAASSAHFGGLQILVKANPTSTSVRDAMGWTPLHLLLLNTRVHITKSQLQVLLGMTVPPEEFLVTGRVRQRRGDHLRLPVEQLSRMLPNPTQNHQRHEISAEILGSYPDAIQGCLKRLQNWERKQSRLEKKRHPEADKDRKEVPYSSSDCVETACFCDERNPAAISTLVDLHLPLHLAVHRGLLGLVKQSRVEQTAASRGHHTDTSKPSKLPSLQHELVVFVRILTQAFPEGLITKDGNGHTPLIAAMTAATEVVPSQQLLELLLGNRTSGFEFLPSWIEDAPLASPHMIVPGNGGLNRHHRRYCNPAMVSTVDTCQLPLHVAAEEWGDHPELILAIFESYPGAIHVQDARGRMPLHILLQNYRRVSPDPPVVALLLSHRVARTHTDEGELPFDLLIACAPFLPRDILRSDSLLLSPNLSHTHPGPNQAFKHIFQPSIIASASAVSASPRERSTLMRRAEANTFLWRLRTLPPWLRRQACSASFVQDIIVEELSSPLRCAYVFAQGLVLVLLLACFRQQMERFIETADQAHIDPVSRGDGTARLSFFDGTGEELVNNLLSDRPGRYEPWKTVAIYGLSAGSITFQAITWTLAGSLNEFQRLCLLSLRRWMDFAAVSAAVSTSVLIHEGFTDYYVFIVGTVATGLLWGALVGFVSDWCYGVSFFTGSVSKVSASSSESVLRRLSLNSCL
jgi:hypothetical protein